LQWKQMQREATHPMAGKRPRPLSRPCTGEARRMAAAMATISRGLPGVAIVDTGVCVFVCFLWGVGNGLAT